MTFSDISGHCSIRICIVLPVFVYNIIVDYRDYEYINFPMFVFKLIFLLRAAVLQSKFEFEMLQWKLNTKFF